MINKYLYKVVVSTLLIVLTLNITLSHVTFATDAKDIDYYKSLPEYHDLHIPLSTANESANGFKFNDYWWIHENYRLIVYGNPSDVPANTYKNGEFRYLGFDASGNPFTNDHYPDDAIGNTPLQYKNWVFSPWKPPYNLCYPTSYSVASACQTDINRMAEHLGWSPGGKGIFFGYVNVQSYPTLLAPGSGTMWHQGKTSVWYDTQQIPKLPARQFDTAVEAALTAPSSAKISSEAGSISLGITLNAHLLDDEWFSDEVQKALHYTRDDIRTWVFTLSYQGKELVRQVAGNGSNTSTASFEVPFGRSDVSDGDAVKFISQVRLVFHNDHESVDADVAEVIFVVEKPPGVPPTDPPPTDPPPTSPPPTTPPPTEAPQTEPPVSQLSVSAGISAPPSAYEGHSFHVTNTSKLFYGSTVYDFSSVYSEGLASSFEWEQGGALGTLDINGGSLIRTLTSSHPEDVEVRLSVQARNGSTDTAAKIIKILPCPYPQIEVTGLLKENRLVTVKSGAILHPLYPASSTSIEVIPVSSGLTAEDVKKSPVSPAGEANFIFKKAGEYKAVVTVTDARGNSGSAERSFTILADLPPVAGLYSASIKIRDPLNWNRALFNVYDKDSRSIDYDSISDRTWGYRYDSDLDGNYSDETYVKVDSGNNPSANMTFDKVGKYRLFLDVKEKFGTTWQPQLTLPEFILPSDFKTATCFFDVEVDNVPPVASFKAIQRKKANIKIVLGSSILAESISAQADMLRSLLLAEGINNSIEIVEHRPDYIVSHWNHLNTDTKIDLALSDTLSDPSYHRIFTINETGGEMLLSHSGGASLLDSDGTLYFTARTLDNRWRIYAIDSSLRSSKIYTRWRSDAAVNSPVVSYPIYSESCPKTGIYRSKTNTEVLYYHTDHTYNNYDQVTKFNKRTGEVLAQAASGNAGYSGLYSDIDWNVSAPYISSLDIEENFEVIKGTDRTIWDEFGNSYHVYYSNGTTCMDARVNGSLKSVSFGGTIITENAGLYPAGRFKMTSFNGKPLVFLTSAGTRGDFSNYQYYCSTAILYGDELLQMTRTYPYTTGQDSVFSHGPEFFIAKFRNKLALTHFRSNMYGYQNVLNPIAEDVMSSLRNYAKVYPNISRDILFVTEQSGGSFFTAGGNIAGMNDSVVNFHAFDGEDQREFISVSDLLNDVLLDDEATKNYILYVNSKDISNFGDAAELIAHAHCNNNSFIAVTNSSHRGQAEILTQNTGGIIIDDNCSEDDVRSVFEQAAAFIAEQLGNDLGGAQTVLINETVDYTTSYFDYEDDPIISGRWKYVHDPGYFDNGNGIASFNNAYLADPVTNFGNKPGRYQVIYQVLDDPPGSSPGDWSAEGECYIYVHRKPVCLASVNGPEAVNRNPDGSYKANATLRIDVSQSYDPDLQFRDPKKGIQGFKVVCKKPDGTLETYYNRENIVLSQQGEWRLAIRVQDKMGVWSDTVEKAVTVKNTGVLQRSISVHFKTADWIYVRQKAEVTAHDVQTVNCSLQSRSVMIRRLGDAAQGGASAWAEVNAVQFLSGNYFINEPGRFEILYRAFNNYGESAEASQIIEVREVAIDGDIVISGSQKVNRKVTLSIAAGAVSGTGSGSGHPITRVEWTVEPVTGGKASDIKIEGSTAAQLINTLYKSSGIYRASLVLFTEINSVEYSKTLSLEFDILPDTAPSASVTAVSPVFRGSQGTAYSDVTLVMESVDDYIAEINWFITYDSDNDGSFLDESERTMPDFASESHPILPLDRGVGKYMIRAQVKEGFSDDTIPAFITASDYKSAEAGTVVEVDNNAPYVDFHAGGEVFLVGEPVTYISEMTGGIVTASGDIYADSENDPIKQLRWKCEHDPSIMPNADSLSTMHNKVGSEPVSRFDKAGKYTISAWAYDDPKPGTASFSNYSMQSYIASDTIIVHRPPKAELNFAATNHVSENLRQNYDFGSGMYLVGTFLKVTDVSCDPDGYPVTTKIEYKPAEGSYSPVNGGSSILLDRPVTYVFKVTVKDLHGAEDVRLYTLEVLEDLGLVPGITPNPVPASEPVVLQLETGVLAKAARAVIFGTNVPLELSSESSTVKVWQAQYVIPADCADKSYAVNFYASDRQSREMRRDFCLTVSTPVDLVPEVPDFLTSGGDCTIRASTSKYVSGVSVTMFDGEDFAASLPLSGIIVGSRKLWTADYSVPDVPEGEYRAVFTAVTLNNNSETKSSAFTISSLKITDVSIEGCWNHWRGQTDIFGRALGNQPHRFLSLEAVKINVLTEGSADMLVIRFSPQLEAMQYTDPMGYVYDYVMDSGMSKYVLFPEDSTFELVGGSERRFYWEYVLPLAPSTLSWDDVRIAPSYSMTVYAYKGSSFQTFTVEDIEITGNVYDLIYIQPK